jgi:hypothetical protein
MGPATSDPANRVGVDAVSSTVPGRVQDRDRPGSRAGVRLDEDHGAFDLVRDRPAGTFDADPLRGPRARPPSSTPARRHRAAVEEVDDCGFDVDHCSCTPSTGSGRRFGDGPVDTVGADEHDDAGRLWTVSVAKGSSSEMR